jgi:hypothetical protein
VRTVMCFIGYLCAWILLTAIIGATSDAHDGELAGCMILSAAIIGLLAVIVYFCTTPEKEEIKDGRR